MSDMYERVSNAFWPDYAVERELGRGGMAIVYLAQDRKYDRPVALKVLRPDLAVDLGAERFLREVRVTARLSHPHILPLFDSGESDGLLYYVTPFVNGPGLREEMKRRGQFPIADAVRITKQVAQALGFAHQAGIIHRDIKPENILLHDGEAMVADFGIALASGDNQRLTRSGLIMGTPAYMSFEQASGADHVDARTDIYSLACVFFEMLAGSPPFHGPTATAILAKLLTRPAPDLCEYRDRVPATLPAILHRALAKAPEHRFSNITEFLDALASVDIAAEESATCQAVNSIAVLPFLNVSADPENEDLCNGVTEELIKALEHVPNLRVAARTSSFAFKDRQANIRHIGEELGVGAVVEGSVRRSANRLRITARLVNVANGFQLWSQHYDEEAEDVSTVRDELAADIAETLSSRQR
ncbi:MAG: protein kinase domain-containing protein [Longimicrobiales bacterium]